VADADVLVSSHDRQKNWRPTICVLLRAKTPARPDLWNGLPDSRHERIFDLTEFERISVSAHALKAEEAPVGYDDITSLQ